MLKQRNIYQHVHLIRHKSHADEIIKAQNIVMTIGLVWSGHQQQQRQQKKKGKGLCHSWLGNISEKV
ncbi:CLUMA_CG007410, isoform A [Clunio marinus]|uniref:CLUMA_CG007410, isoform A n=1 Tax=Clunio marinus TaxID=568069 RepID=A0A1J1I103_9DIPT|nr:CLUMA_CG007410, isoform A [Clunio marinus]